MDRDQINERIALLFLCLQFCTDQMRMFTVGERICINQERAQWMYIKEFPIAIPRPVSVKIEAKMTDVVRLVGIYNFLPINKDPFRDEHKY
jgi:hypothetical protein